MNTNWSFSNIISKFSISNIIAFTRPAINDQDKNINIRALAQLSSHSEWIANNEGLLELSLSARMKIITDKTRSARADFRMAEQNAKKKLFKIFQFFAIHFPN